MAKDCTGEGGAVTEHEEASENRGAAAERGGTADKRRGTSAEPAGSSVERGGTANETGAAEGGRLLYLDASALVKLVLPEAESEALLERVRASPERVASAIASVEVVRAARRASNDPAVEQRAHEVVAAVNLITLSDSLLAAAATASPRSLRALDALHLQTARLLGDDLEAMVVYDGALADAARAAGIRVIAPAPDVQQDDGV